MNQAEDSATGPGIDGARLCGRLAELGRIGALPGGGCTRLALSAEDKAGRELVVSWMEDAGLETRIDAIGNILAVPPGYGGQPAVLTGSHIDTVREGGLYDGCLGVLGGLEAVRTIREAGLETVHPLAVAVFTDEEGARFQPDMMGSSVFTGAVTVAEARACRDRDGITVGEALDAIGFAGPEAPGAVPPLAFLELHVEQGPVLDAAGLTIGAVDGVQGFTWLEFAFTGVANHAGTTPMAMRRDAGRAACRLAAEAPAALARGSAASVITAGSLRLEPDVVNVIAGRATVTVDLRDPEPGPLASLEAAVRELAGAIAGEEAVTVEIRELSRFAPVTFDSALVARIEAAAGRLGHPVRRMPSGAGHDAQALARHVPTAMIFVPSTAGISHSPHEHTRPEHLEAGANVLMQVMLEVARDGV